MSKFWYIIAVLFSLCLFVYFEPTFGAREIKEGGVGGKEARGGGGVGREARGGAGVGRSFAGGGGGVRGGARPHANLPSPSMSRAEPRLGNYAEHHKQHALGTYLHAASRQAPTGFNRQSHLAYNQIASHVAQKFHHQHPNAHNWFNHNFYNAHGFHHPGYWAHEANLWNAANWASAAAWVGYAPVDGGYPAYYYNDEGYYTDLPAQEAAAYSTSLNLEASVSIATPTQDDWLSLGVYAVGSTAQQAVYSNMIVQLSINRNGEMAGTYYNAATDLTHTLTGQVDKSTQRAAWQMADKEDSPVATTGYYNLTQNVVPIQVHFATGDVQSKVMVRVNAQ
jgi:hypothetical protein